MYDRSGPKSSIPKTNLIERTVHPPNGTRRFYGLACLVLVGCMHLSRQVGDIILPRIDSNTKCCPTRMCERDVFRMLQVDQLVGRGSAIGAIREDPH